MRARFVGLCLVCLPLCPAAAMARGIRITRAALGIAGGLFADGAQIDNLAHAQRLAPALPPRQCRFPCPAPPDALAPQIVAASRATKRRSAASSAASARAVSPRSRQGAGENLAHRTGAPGQRRAGQPSAQFGRQAVIVLHRVARAGFGAQMRAAVAPAHAACGPAPQRERVWQVWQAVRPLCQFFGQQAGIQLGF